MKAIIRIKTVRKPISARETGLRFEAAIPNMQGRKMKALRENGEVVDFRASKEEAPSWRKPYLIADSSDFFVLSAKDHARFLEKLRWYGYSEFEYMGKFDGKTLEEAIEELGD